MRFYDTPTRLQILRQFLALNEARAASHRNRVPMLLRLCRLLGWTAALAAVPMLLLQAAAQTVQNTKAPKIVAIAGNRTVGYVATQDGGPTIHAPLDEPYGTALDRNGNLYIAEPANHRICRIDAATGTITTVAGNGRPGFRSTDEGGPATAAQLNEPRAVAMDATGNLYIADTGNHRIRKVLADTGTIHTMAGTGTAGYLAAQGGGPAIDAELNDPCGIALDILGNLYIADTGNHRIRRVEVHTGLVTTVAGNGTPSHRIASQGKNANKDEGKLATRASLNAPTQIAVDAVGNLYIADMNESRIRRVDAATGTITTFAAAGVPGYIAAQDGQAGALARLNKPRAVALDPHGNLYNTDSANNRIRKVETARISVNVAAK